MLASYALGTEKKQASGIVETLESARYRAKLSGREQPIFVDVEAALIHDHRFLSERKKQEKSATAGEADAQHVQSPCNVPAAPLRRTAGESEFPIQVCSSSDPN